MAGNLRTDSKSGPDIYERVILRTGLKTGKAECVFTDGTSILLPMFVVSFLHSGDTLCFPIGGAAENESTEIYVRRRSPRHREEQLLLVEIGYAQRPRDDPRNRLQVYAEVRGQHLGIANIQFRCDVLRDYFYVADRYRAWDRQPSFYELLRVDPNVSPADLRVAFKLRILELRTSAAPSCNIHSLERAFNTLAQPELRESYNRLLVEPEAPVSFPYGGFGFLLASGSVSTDGGAFLASQILAFRPHQSTKTVRAALRNCTFYQDLALYRDARRKLEVLLDRSALGLSWDPSWNRWKHLLGAHVRIKGVFIQAGKYRHHNGAWELRIWETALPSRVEVTLAQGIAEQIVTTKKNYQRFGQFSESLEQIRSRLETVPLERDELRGLCSKVGIPSDFDVALITWKPDYEDFYYKQLCERARCLYLFRTEYIFDLETVVVVETPQLGHATYLFAKSSSMQDFLARYRSVRREDILQNRNNVAEQLGFLCRIIHGQSRQNWLKDLKACLGEIPMPAPTVVPQ